LLKLGRVFSL